MMYLSALLNVTSQISLQSCIGLHNRETTSETDATLADAYTLAEGRYDIDQIWLSELSGVVPAASDPDDYLRSCFSSTSAQGYILYDYSKQKYLMPNIITYASLHSSIPIDVSDLSSFSSLPPLPLFSDLTTLWSHMTPYTATLHMFKNYINQTTSLAKLNPGYDFKGMGHDIMPNRDGGDIDVLLVDYVYKEKLFLMYLARECVPKTLEHKLFNRIVTENNWKKPVKVYGYEDSVPVFGGDVFEAETNCASPHNLGQIATKGVNNLSYFSKKSKQIKSPLQQNPTEDITYASTLTYVAIIIGDGDNLNILKTRNLLWWSSRVSRCRDSDKKCFPLSWTTSPQLKYILPDMMRYFYEEAERTGRDYFVLPPSGDMYSYPSLMPEEVQDEYVDDVVEDFRIMSTRSSVHWEWFFSWSGAIKNYFPKFSNLITSVGFFLTDVPFDVPIPEFSHLEDFKIVGENNNVVLFKPNEWRGVDGETEQSPSARDMARRINGAPNGTITHIYLTSDGGASIDSIYEMVAYLEEDVVLVSADALIDLAVQKGI
ncbi:hypothetical protein TrVE_jg11004 [Triparma verrucosa]|uniref:GxGYxYP putative glycoside hydrolase C-terminal domain-containing protein n=1 Tax=Triparma verrucosa TaxID=1606542 RepID=A0A9W7EY25_9STRA|nr:hypothetical protein TrVE_jg11004 [Triparma verrucosa]